MTTNSYRAATGAEFADGDPDFHAGCRWFAPMGQRPTGPNVDLTVKRIGCGGNFTATEKTDRRGLVRSERIYLNAGYELDAAGSRRACSRRAPRPGRRPISIASSTWWVRRRADRSSKEPARLICSPH
jgi:hypothetical protein